MALVAIAAASCLVLGTAGSASAAEDPFLTESSFAVLGHTTITNTGPTVINGDLGLTGTEVTGFPPGIVNGGVHIDSAVADVAEGQAQAAYTNAANQFVDEIVLDSVELAGRTLVAGLYSSGGILENNGTLTFDGDGASDGIWVMQSSETLITGPGSQMLFIDGANPCNVFWQVPTSATLGTNSTFIGTIMASASVTATTGATVTGRLIALTGAVNLDSNIITSTGCAATTTSSPLPAGYTAADFTTGVVAVPAPAPAVPAAPSLPDTGTELGALPFAAMLLGSGLLAVGITQVRRAKRSRADGSIAKGRS